MNSPIGKHALLAALIAALAVVAAPPSGAQPASARPTNTYDKPPLKKEELEQLLAPIALYPDSLVTQMLMASTYPLEIVQADRWVKAHKDLKGDALAKELEKESWDPSVKSLVNFPDQLSMMNDKLELTLKIGNAFLEQQADVLNTVQALRNRAQAEGTLKSNDKQKVIVQAAAPTTNTTVVNIDMADSGQLTQPVVQQSPQVIVIESANPDVVYVPSYNPTYAYGAWPYPAYPPSYYYPPGYYYGSNLVSFGVGVALGAAWGYAWGGCNWGNSNVDIDVDRNINRNTNINRDTARQNIQNRQTNRQGNRDGRQGNRQSWQHDPSHRQGAAYRDQRTSDRFGGANSSSRATQAREQYRGRAEAGRQDLARGGADQFRGGAERGGAGGSAAQNRASAGGGGAQNRASAGGAAQNRGGTAANRTPSSANRGYSGTRGGTFNGVSGGSSGARAEAARGRSSGSRSAPSRGGGGGGRGGGGRGGGGGRR